MLQNEAGLEAVSSPDVVRAFLDELSRVWCWCSGIKKVIRGIEKSD
jgi:hypothetical protein